MKNSHFINDDLNALRTFAPDALKFCHDAARFDLEKAYEVTVLPATEFTEKRIARNLSTVGDYSAVIFFDLYDMPAYRHHMAYAAHFSAIAEYPGEGILNAVFPFYDHSRFVHTCCGRTHLEAMRKEFRKGGRTIYIIAQRKEFLRPSEEFTRDYYRTRCEYPARIHMIADRILRGTAYDPDHSSGRKDRCGNDRYKPLCERIIRADAIRRDREQADAANVDNSTFRAEIAAEIDECKRLVRQYITDYDGHNPFAADPYSHLRNAIDAFRVFCEKDSGKTFRTIPEIVRRKGEITYHLGECRKYATGKEDSSAITA